VLRLRGGGSDQPGAGETFRLVGDLTALADGRLVLLTPDGDAHDLADVLAALVGEGRDRVPGAPWVGRGDRHIGQVSLVLEVLDRHDGQGRSGVYVPGRSTRP
jgi:hypothetical protein